MIGLVAIIAIGEKLNRTQAMLQDSINGCQSIHIGNGGTGECPVAVALTRFDLSGVDAITGICHDPFAEAAHLLAVVPGIPDEDKVDLLNGLITLRDKAVAAYTPDERIVEAIRAVRDDLAGDTPVMDTFNGAAAAEARLYNERGDKEEAPDAL